MTLAAVHLAPQISVSIALVLAAALVWYWIRLGRADVPVSRRKIRRFSLGVMLFALPAFVRGLSFLDHTVAADKPAYVLTWTVATFMLLIVIATALMDAINNLRLHQQQRSEDLHAAAMELADAVRERRRQTSSGVSPARVMSPDDPATSNGHAGAEHPL